MNVFKIRLAQMLIRFSDAIDYSGLVLVFKKFIKKAEIASASCFRINVFYCLCSLLPSP